VADTPDDASGEDTAGESFRKFLEGLTEEARDFTRRRPVEGLLLSFIAGMVVSDLLRRNR